MAVKLAQTLADRNRAVLAMLGMAAVLVLAPRLPAQPEAKAASERHMPLKGEPAAGDGVERIGPQAEQCVRFEPDGLRIMLPAGFPGERPNTGVRIPLPVKGDFDASVTFEVLAEPDPATVGKPTKCMLLVQLERGDWTVAALSRRVAPKKGTQLTAWTIRDNNENSGKRKTQYREFATPVKNGRLRIARTGAEIGFYLADGPAAAYMLLHKLPCGPEDLASIELTAATGEPHAIIDVRFTDLRVRSGAALAPVAAEEPQAPAATARSPVNMILLVVILVLAAITAGVLWWRSRRRAEMRQEPCSRR